MSRNQLKIIQPAAGWEPKPKRPPKKTVVVTERKIVRPPAVYSNRSWEDTMNYYENLKIEKHASRKLARGRRNF